MGAGELLFFVLKPSNALALLLVAGLLVLPWRRRLGLAAVTLSAVLFVVLGLLPVGKAALALLETRFALVEPAEPPDGIVVLGGYISPSITGSKIDLPLNEHADRLTTAASLALRYPQAKLILSDGGDPVPGATLSGTFLRSIGLAPERIVTETASRSTLDNAVMTRDVVAPAADGRYILVTSAFHMPRAVGAFRAAGWPEPIPWPVDYRSDGRPFWLGFTGSVADGLRFTDLAAREYLALLQYRLMGWTDALLPAPRAP